MSITVADCLRVPALREAQVVAGHNGLDRIVSSVSVLEYADTSALESQLFLGNEAIISAFVSVKDDVGAQCKVIRRLHTMGEVCLILYYVGIYVPRVDEKLIKTADELDFPLIVMPPFQYNHRYSEAISDVVAAIINDQKQENWHPVKGFNWCGIIAWVLGSIVALFFSFFSPALDGIIVCAVAYVILYKVAGKTALGGQGELSIEDAEANLK